MHYIMFECLQEINIGLRDLSLHSIASVERNLMLLYKKRQYVTFAYSAKVKLANCSNIDSITDNDA